jgi:hypothetical protein
VSERQQILVPVSIAIAGERACKLTRVIGSGMRRNSDAVLWQEALILSAKAYAGPLGTCDIVSVSETPSPKGSTYSARLQCADPRQEQKKTPGNLIIRPGEANQISVGPRFESLKVYQRCSESTPASK